MKEIIIANNFAVEEAVEYREELNKLIEKGERHFVMNFRACNFIDSTGLGVLVTVYKKVMELGGSFELNSIYNPQVMKIFKLTRLDKVFDIK